MKKPNLRHHYTYSSIKTNYHRTFDLQIETGPGTFKIRKDQVFIIPPFHTIEAIILEFLHDLEIRVSIFKFDENNNKYSESQGIMEEHEFQRMIEL